MKYLSTSGFCGMGVLACPIDTNPMVRLRNLCRTGMKKLKRVCRKSKTLVLRLFRSGGVSLENCCVKMLALKMNFPRTPMRRTLEYIFEIPCTGIEPKLPKLITE